MRWPTRGRGFRPIRLRHLRHGCWFLILVLLGPTRTTVRADDPDNCLLCHQYRGLGRYVADDDALHLYYTNPDYHRRVLGAHARIACTDCHERSEVNVIPHRDVSPVDCTRACHLSDISGVARQFDHANVARMLESSAHAREQLAPLEFTGGPLLERGQSLCLYCHDEPLYRMPESLRPLAEHLDVHTLDRCDVCHKQQIPTDSAFYFKHIASRLQHARAPLEMTQTCAVCHSDPRVLERTGLSDAVASFLHSFHGKAALLGDSSTADCLGCHVAAGENAHLMLGQDDPQSAVHATRVADSCRSTACHPGADRNIGAAAVHLDLATERGTLEFWVAVGFIILTVVTFGPSLMFVVLELFQLVIGRQHRGAHEMEQLAKVVLAHPEGRRRLTRFTINQRVQHWILAVLFALLALTGFPLKFADQAWAQWLIDFFGGLRIARHIHHTAGVALVVGFFAHVLYVLWALRQRMRARQTDGSRTGPVAAVLGLPMLIRPRDLYRAGQLMLYLVGLRKSPPVFGRFTVKEKLEYTGVAWGTILLGVTGALLWGEQISSRFLSGRVLNIALIAHTYEAFLAVIHVGILHICSVTLNPHVFPLSLATVTGQTPVAELAGQHSEQVAEVARELGIAGPEGH